MPDRDPTGSHPTRPAPTGMPQWVKVFLIIAVALLLALVIMRLAGVQHGPGLHTPPGGGHVSPTQHGP